MPQETLPPDHDNEVVNGQALLGSVEIKVTFTVDTAGKLSAQVVDFKNGETYTYSDDKDIKDIVIFVLQLEVF